MLPISRVMSVILVVIRMPVRSTADEFHMYTKLQYCNQMYKYEFLKYTTEYRTDDYKIPNA